MYEFKVYKYNGLSCTFGNISDHLLRSTSPAKSLINYYQLSSGMEGDHNNPSVYITVKTLNPFRRRGPKPYSLGRSSQIFLLFPPLTNSFRQHFLVLISIPFLSFHNPP
ncbi:hypothetical protein L1887_33993 [Cichorium endivia]|nr:hypothetical protein L1887_33993 [Cichorium endivia]